MARRLKMHASHIARPALTRETEVALRILRDAYELAERFNAPASEFAVEMQELHDAGVSANTLRSLVLDGQVEHVVELTSNRSKKRSFCACRNLRFGVESCFTLSATGLKAVHQLLVKESPETEVPRWDAETRTLLLGGRVVKRFHRVASNQETVLAAFEAKNWPPRILDPLPVIDGRSPKRRLHEKIKSLNHSQIDRCLHFIGDGSSRGVGWERRRRQPHRREPDGRLVRNPPDRP